MSASINPTAAPVEPERPRDDRYRGFSDAPFPLPTGLCSSLPDRLLFRGNGAGGDCRGHPDLNFPDSAHLKHRLASHRCISSLTGMRSCQFNGEGCLAPVDLQILDKIERDDVFCRSGSLTVRKTSRTARSRDAGSFDLSEFIVFISENVIDQRKKDAD